MFAISALVNNKLRTVLSLLGVTIGIFLIISVFTLVDSLEDGVRSSFDGLGDDAVFVQKMPWGPEAGDEAYEWWRYIQRPDVTFEQSKMLKEKMTTAKAVSFLGSSMRSVEYKSSSANNVAVVAVSEGFENFVAVEVEQGRNFTKSELLSHKRYCVIGFEVANRLFAESNPIGKVIKVSGYKGTVIGVLEKEGQGFGNGSDEWVLVPVEFARLLMNMKKAETRIALKPKDNVSQKMMENEALMHLRGIRRLRPNERNDFAMNRSSMINQGLDQVFGLMSWVGAIIGGFSILVGGFSIANIMFVSVRERTNIIGIQKALGAKKNFILFQFLFESVFLCLFGGAIGLLIIWLGAFLAGVFSDFELTLTISNALIGVTVSVVIGLISGIVPAFMAARMEPVDAIRSNS